MNATTCTCIDKTSGHVMHVNEKHLSPWPLNDVLIYSQPNYSSQFVLCWYIQVQRHCWVVPLGRGKEKFYSATSSALGMRPICWSATTTLSLGNVHTVAMRESDVTQEVC